MDMDFAGGFSFEVPTPPGEPKQVLMMDGWGQKGTVSVNTANNPHWNDVLSFTSDGSLVRFDGMDFMLEGYNKVSADVTGKIKYNRCCGLRCCVKTSSESKKQMKMSWKSTDGVHTIRLEHKAGSAFKADAPGCCAGCFPCTPLCCSKICCQSCCRSGKVNYDMLSPEFMDVFYDEQVVAKLEVQPGIANGTTVQAPDVQRMTTAKDASGKTMFVMNDVYLPKADEEVEEQYKCCALPCPCCEPCKWCCCPCVMPFCGGLRCPKISCGCCTPCCDMFCRCLTCTCNCVPCIMCAGSCCAMCSKCCSCCKASCGTCLECGCVKCGVTEEVSGVTGEYETGGIVSLKHKAHRNLYPLMTTQGGTEVYGWAAYTHVEGPHLSHRATLTMDPSRLSGGVFGSSGTPKELLAALPLLVDLAYGSNDVERTKWTFESRVWGKLFDPITNVHYWPKPQALQSVAIGFDLKTCINPTQGDIAPKQQTMNDPSAKNDPSATAA